MSDDILSDIAEPTATDDTTADNDNATPDQDDPTLTPEETPQDQQPEPEGGDEISTEDLLGEIRESAGEDSPKVSDEQRDKDREARAAKFNLQFNHWMNRVSKYLKDNDGSSIEDAVVELNVPANIAGKLTKSVNEDLGDDDAPDKPNIEELAINAAKKLRAQERAENLLTETIAANKLNTNTPEAVAMRKKLVSEYKRYAATLSPDEAAEIAILKSGLKDKTLYKQAFKAGQKDGNLAKPKDGEAGKPSPKVPTEITLENIGNLTPEQIRALNKKAMGLRMS